MNSDTMDRGKVRVFTSVFAGYRFLFTRFLRLLHVAWFPGVLFVTAGIFANELMRDVNIGAMDNTGVADALTYLLGVMGVYSVFQLAMTLVVVVGFYRVALYDFRPRLPIYFRFRSDELRTASVWFLVVVALYTVFMALVYLTLLGVGGLVGNSGSQASLLQTLGTSNVFGFWAMISMLVMYWVYARFFLAMPAALEHHATTLGEVWAATKGNNIRLTVYVIILVLSLVGFLLALNFLVIAAAFVAAALLAGVLSPGAVAEVSARAQDIEAVVMNLPAWGRFIVIGISQIGVFFGYVFFWAIVIGSASSAFRDIFPDEDA